MATSDIIAIGVLVILAILGAKGKLRWVTGTATGLLLACVLLAVVGLLGRLPWFSNATGDYLKGGTVIPAVTEQATHVGRRIGIRFPAEGRESVASAEADGTDQ